MHYLLHQGIVIRNDHAGGSNLSVKLEKVLGESAWVTEGKYHSPECVNEMIEIMAHKVLHSLISDVQSHKWYFILADETRDLSNHEQMVICLRWVSNEYEVCEDLIGLVQLDNITSDMIYSVLKDSIICLGLGFGDCRGQGYDGAQNFQGQVWPKDLKMTILLLSQYITWHNALISAFRKLQEVANVLKKH